MMLRIFYKGDNPQVKYYENFKDWEKTSLQIVEDIVKSGKERKFDFDIENFNPHEDIWVDDGVYSKDQYKLELSENLTCDQIEKIINKYFKPC